MTAIPGPSDARVREPDGGFHEELEHTADLALRCGGPDMDALFRHAARGMYRLMGAHAGGQSSRGVHTVSLEAPDVETLLVDWLSELAYLVETRGDIFRDIAFASLSTTRLEATLSDGRRARVETVIKAVTYHDLKVTESPEGYTATVVFDV